MTKEEVDAAIGRMISSYDAKLKECAALRGEIGSVINSMKTVVDSALMGDRFNPNNIRRDDVPDDGWAPLKQLIDQLHDCRSQLDRIEEDLRIAGLERLIRDR